MRTTHHPKYKAVILSQDDIEVLIDSIEAMASTIMGANDVLRIAKEVKRQTKRQKAKHQVKLKNAVKGVS
jgi:hypothetical protein